MKKTVRNNIFFFGVIILLVLPQTRKSIQVFLHKGIAFFTSANPIAKEKRKTLESYKWELVNEKGEIFNFNMVKDKVLVINFWATWCPPCIAEMPSLQKLYDTYKNKVEFIFVTSDTNEKVQNFKKSKNYSFPVYQEHSNAPEVLATKSIPRTLVIDNEGTIIIDKSGAVNWFSDDIKAEIDLLLENN